MIGVNIRTDAAAGVDYAAEILAGRKSLETRSTNSLRPYVGRRVAIVRTGAGPAHAIGTVQITAGYCVTARVFRNLEPLHLVPQGSLFDVAPDGVKWIYRLENPRAYKRPRACAPGIVARRILGPLPYPKTGRHGDSRGL